MRLTPLIIALAISSPAVSAQTHITSPKEEFGHNIGDDYFLTNYDQLTKYWQKLDKESDRMKVVRIGTSSEGRPMWMAIITSPRNHANLAHYQDIAARLAHAEGLTDQQAHALAKEGKAVVWIDGGLHATEVLGAQQLVEWVYEMVSRNDAETQRFLRDVILLAVPANPDGMDIVSNWYMRQSDTLKRTTNRVPVLYNKYAGHDNNRDSYMASLAETRAMD
ncbi:MAG TPA: M14 family zinc carboxypeptidase, partial [Gemmatimonadaceae bacterium]|nr:M14 family zinc carboxypeptidase [Gemmatimonadaceae bacterium]